MGYVETALIMGWLALSGVSLFLLQNKEKQEKFLKWINSL